MSHVHAKGSIEARLDRLKKRLSGNEHPMVLAAVLKGILDLLSDVLLEEQQPMTAEKAEEMSRRAT